MTPLLAVGQGDARAESRSAGAAPARRGGVQFTTKETKNTKAQHSHSRKYTTTAGRTMRGFWWRNSGVRSRKTDAECQTPGGAVATGTREPESLAPPKSDWPPRICPRASPAMMPAARYTLSQPRRRPHNRARLGAMLKGSAGVQLARCHMLRVFSARDPAEAHLVKALLAGHGIAAVVQGEALWGARGSLGLGYDSTPSVWVAEPADAERAAHVIKTEFGPRNPTHCAHCGYNLWGLPEPRCPECGRRPSPGLRRARRSLGLRRRG